MFDAKSLLEALVTGGAQRQGSQGAGAGGDLGDLLGGILSGAKPGGGATSSGHTPQQTSGGIEDLLRQMLPSGSGNSGSGTGANKAGGGLGDILGNLQKQLGGGAGASGGSITDMLGQVFGQATSGAKEGASRIGEASGAREALEKMTGGKSMDDLLGQLKELIGNNQLGAGAALGGLGALVFGTQSGRTIAANAAKLGALSVIGGLAYRAYQNDAQGRSPAAERNFVPTQAPAGSGFEPAAISNEQAALYIRAMIGAAAADGRISADEQQKILGSLNQTGLNAGAEEFLANELNNPASAGQLAAAVNSEQEAVQVYTAARIAIDPDTRGEQAFLYELAQRLSIPEDLRAHIDAAAASGAA